MKSHTLISNSSQTHEPKLVKEYVYPRSRTKEKKARKRNNDSPGAGKFWILYDKLNKCIKLEDHDFILLRCLNFIYTVIKIALYLVVS